MILRKQDGAIRPQQGYTQFPNLFIDQLMPVLGDTEWRLLVVVARQTLGRKRQDASGGGDNQRKSSDWLTQAQLKKRTGRASAAVSKALDSLVELGFICASSETCETLDTPEKRRAHGGRMRYRLSDGLLTACGIRPSTRAASTSSSTYPQTYSLSGVWKANTTKERTYKREIQNKEADATNHPVKNAGDHTHVRLYAGWQNAADLASARRRRMPPQSD